ADDTYEMPVAPVGRKNEDRTRTRGLRFDAVHRSFSKCSDLCAALGVGKANAVVAPTKPRPLQSQHLHPPETGQEHEPDSSEPGRVLAFGCSFAHHASETTDFVFTQPSLAAADCQLPDAFRRIFADDADTSGVA